MTFSGNYRALRPPYEISTTTFPSPLAQIEHLVRGYSSPFTVLFPAEWRRRRQNVTKALNLVRWAVGTELAGSYRPHGLEWYEISMSPSQWGIFSTLPEMNNEARWYGILSNNSH